MSLQLKTELWVQALTRRANDAGSYTSVERIGDKERGDVLVKVVTGSGEASIYGQVFNPDQSPVFKRLPEGAPVETEKQAADYMERRVRYDPDLWVMEIQDKKRRHFLTERVLPDIDPFA